MLQIIDSKKIEKASKIIGDYPNKYIMIVDSYTDDYELGGENVIGPIYGRVYAVADAENSRDFGKFLHDEAGKFDNISILNSFSDEEVDANYADIP